MPETITREQIEQRVVEALIEFGEDADAVSLDARFEELDVDSLDLVELAQIIEDEYGVQIGDADMDGLQTVRDVVELVTARAA